VDSCTGTAAGVGSGTCTLALTTVGNRTLTATYLGDAIFAGSSDTEPHTVVTGVTTTTITSDTPDPSVVGQNVMVNYTVTAAVGTPTGNVTVSDGVDSCTGTAAGVGSGTCTLALTTVGNRTLTATYLATLTVVIDGLGAVNSQGATPAINCSYVGGTCSATYPFGTQVTLVATSQNPDFSWESWFGTGSGFTCTTNPTCVVTMDQDRTVRAFFSAPGIISVNPSTASFTMTQGGTPTPTSQTISVSNIGDRPVTLSPIQIAYLQDVAPWLRATIDKGVIDTLSPGTMTLSILSNNLDPGVYNATVYVGDFVITTGQVDVTLTVLPTGPPVLSNISQVNTGVNDCDIFQPDPPGSSFTVPFDYADGEGDVSSAVSNAITVSYVFRPSGSSGSFDGTPFSTWTGDGFTGSIDSYQCYLFGGASSVDVTVTLKDLAGNVSNGITVNIPAPANANAPPAGGATASVDPQAGPNPAPPQE
jgi:hypothetical protein